MGLGIHVPARVMGQFAIFCLGYGSALRRFAIVMDKFSQFISIVKYNDKNLS